MAASKALKEGFSLSEATEDDLASLATIHARSFHPNNEFQRLAMPDTPVMRNWWFESFKKGLADPKTRVFVVRDTNRAQEQVIAMIRLKFFEKDEGGAGFFDDELTEDHDVEKCTSLMKPALEKRPKLTQGRSQYVIEMFGTDQNYQGDGAGSALLARCCQVADEEGINTFVVANGKASSFYTRFGFEIRDETILPPSDYRLCFMIRPPR